MNAIVGSLTAYLPADLDFMTAVRFALIVAVGALILGLAGHFIFGKKSGLNHSVSSAVGIMFVYALTIVIYTFQPGDLSRFLSPLPFISLHGEYMLVFSFTGSEFTAICTEVLNMVILAFLVNILDHWMPKGKTVVGWYLLRFLTVVLGLLAQLVVTGLLTHYLPGVVVTYAPIILVGILLVMVLLGLVKAVLGLVLTVVNPILGAIYGFFFASKIGRMLGRAVVTTVLLSALVYLLEYFQYSVIAISPEALASYLPLIAGLLVIWYILGHLL